ncbi:hypothetical protein BKA65DRAFT_27303 [Rhexocercosporidium sp. MPI-PUGE-AT-0058]|nr:hypothetical protein BKA65DRAFT_27303 [Rhexocercosporidium sp. MPI-PUGE-AT-0058]
MSMKQSSLKWLEVPPDDLTRIAYPAGVRYQNQTKASIYPSILAIMRPDGEVRLSTGLYFISTFPILSPLSPDGTLPWNPGKGSDRSGFWDGREFQNFTVFLICMPMIFVPLITCHLLLCRAKKL